MSYNSRFDIRALFSAIDADQNGYLTPAELTTWAAAHPSLEGLDWNAITKEWNNGADGDAEEQRLYFDEFNHAILGGFRTETVVRHHIDPYGRSYVVSTSYGASNKETEETYKSNIDSSLANVILEHSKLVSDNGKALTAD